MQNTLQITLYNLLWLTSGLPPVSGRHFFHRFLLKNMGGCNNKATVTYMCKFITFYKEIEK
jgi:hypothetical protein